MDKPVSLPTACRHLVCLLIIILARVCLAADCGTQQKPNIILILADDLGIGNVGVYGADHFKTPNIDQLAATGIRFQRFYSEPLCAPARAKILTGRFNFRTGMTSNWKQMPWHRGFDVCRIGYFYEKIQPALENIGLASEQKCMDSSLFRAVALQT